MGSVAAVIGEVPPVAGAAPRVAVIGAGLAGLSCATALQAAGVVVRVYEKSRGPAGRMSTRRGDGWQCDHGAQYFTVRDPAFRAEVARWQQAGVAARWSPRLAVLGGTGEHDTDPAIERFVGMPRMTAPAAYLAASLAVSTGLTIRQLERRPEGWRLLSAERGVIDEHYDRVLIGVPAPQAVPLLTGHAPVLAATAASARMRGCWAMMLRFPTPVELGFDAAFVNAGPIRWIARDRAKPGRAGQETWLIHAGAEWSDAHLETDPERVAGILTDAFARLGGPPPAAWTAHRWRHADTGPPLALGCAWSARTGLGLCGDWLNGGRVEGAWTSGRRLAQAVLASCDGAPVG